MGRSRGRTDLAPLRRSARAGSCTRHLAVTWRLKPSERLDAAGIDRRPRCDIPLHEGQRRGQLKIRNNRQPRRHSTFLDNRLAGNAG